MLWNALLFPLTIAMTTKAQPQPKANPINVLGTPLQSCNTDPMTGWFRNGFCESDSQDRGVHVVCAQVTQAFLDYSKTQGNDLITPHTEYGFPGLKAGDRWCLCALRWRQGLQAGFAPPVVLEATDSNALKFVTLADLQAHTA